MPGNNTIEASQELVYGSVDRSGSDFRPRLIKMTEVKL